MLKIIQSPKFMRIFNGWMTVLWVVMVPLSILTGWINSVPFISALSLWALVASHLAAWQASRVEENQQGGDQNASNSSS